MNAAGQLSPEIGRYLVPSESPRRDHLGNGRLSTVKSPLVHPCETLHRPLEVSSKSPPNSTTNADRSSPLRTPWEGAQSPLSPSAHPDPIPKTLHGLLMSSKGVPQVTAT